MTVVQYILPLLLSVFTGWFVIWIVIKFLFRPLKPVSVGIFKIQGIIPANQKHIAGKIGRLVVEDLFSIAALQEKMASPGNFEKLKPEIESHIDGFLRERLKDTFPMLAMLIGDKTINQLKQAFLLELETLFPLVIKSYMSKLEADLNLEKEISEKINSFSVAKLETLVYKSAGKQIIKLQLLGAAIGLLTGLLHILINTQLFN